MFLQDASLAWRILGDHFGGCSPIKNKTALKLHNSTLFNFNASTVARPVGVKPSIRNKSTSQQKCSSQIWILGLNSGAKLRLSESNPSILVYLMLLHPRQAKAKFSTASEPLFTCGIICSTENFEEENAAGVRQYSQMFPARWATKALVFWERTLAMIKRH